MPREQGRKLVTSNKKARHDYHIHDTFEAGIVLQGTEVKSLRHGRCSLQDSFATVDDGEVWLRQANIPEYEFGTWTNHSAKRNRKLLLHKKEIAKLAREAANAGVTIVPLAVYFSDGYAKVEIGLATGKKEWDKRHTLMEREHKREAERAVSDRFKRGRR